MKELKCPNCGGPLVRDGFGQYHCEYCNSKFKEIEYGELRLIQIGQPHCKVIEAYTNTIKKLKLILASLLYIKR